MAKSCIVETPSSADRTPTPSSFVSLVSEVEEEVTSAHILFDFTPTSPFELAVSGELMLQVSVVLFAKVAPYVQKVPMFRLSKRMMDPDG